MECIILTEKSGFKVDGVASDGASWNRSMWDKFGVTEEEDVSHIMDPERRLWFFSDFPHLIKCLRNFFSKHNQYNGIWVSSSKPCINSMNVYYKSIQTLIVSFPLFPDTRWYSVAKALVCSTCDRKSKIF